MYQPTFYRSFQSTYRGPWQPEAPPALDGVTEIELDVETTGLRWWDGDRPIGIAIRYGDKRQYLPWGHAGGNLDEETVRRWARSELRGKHITNLNTRFDLHMLYAWGVDLESQGCTVSDVGHYAALLDDHRQTFSLENISQDYLGVGKFGKDLDKTQMASYHAGEVADYAMQDVELVGQLKQIMLPRLQEQDLMRVKELEDKIIWVVCEMERNGAKIDVELLHKWLKLSEQEYLRCLWEIYRETQIKFEPTTAGWEKLFRYERIPITDYTEPTEAHPQGQPSFTDEVLKRIDNRLVNLGRRSQRLKSLSSKYLQKYANNVDSNGIIRYALHQLRADKDPDAPRGAAGTVSGRFSSSEIVSGFGVNIQQVMKVAKQRVAFGYDEEDETHDEEIFIVRQLHIPGEGGFLSADAKQIEYRLFADKAKNPKVLAAYKENPDLSFHKFMHATLKPFANLIYRQQKDLNFAKIYAAGLAKLALMLGYISSFEYASLQKKYNGKVPRDEPSLRRALDVEKIYAREIPEVSVLIRKASHLAMPECDPEYCNKKDELHKRFPHRGYVRTITGRRSRFPNGNRIHKALNAVIQGTAADIMKQKLVELHENRKDTGLLLRFTVHDEVDGDARSPETSTKVKKILDLQSFQTTIPILWDVEVGKNWKDLGKPLDSFDTAHELRELVGKLGDDEVDSKKSVTEREKEGSI